jgi:hypothetical protein
MWDNLIGRLIRRSIFSLMVWNFAFLFFLAIAAYGMKAYWINFFAGPMPLGHDALLTVRDANLNEYFVSVECAGAVDSGLREFTTFKQNDGSVRSRAATAKYQVLEVGEKLLIAKSPIDDPAIRKRATGKLVNLPDPLRNELSRAYGRRTDVDVLNESVLPVMLDTSNYRSIGWKMLALGLPAMLLCVWNVIKAARRLGNHDLHPLAKVMRRFGEPSEVACHIERESAGEKMHMIGGAIFTRSWLIRSTMFSVDLVHLADAAWMYKSRISTYLYGVPAGTSFGTVLCDIRGKAFSFRLSDSQCDAFIIAVSHRVPWILVGFDDKLQQLWKKNKQAIYDMVESRRQCIAEYAQRDLNDRIDQRFAKGSA